MKLSLFLLIGLGICNTTLASSDGHIIQISRALKMRSAHSIPDKEFFVDMGTQDGVAVGSVMRVFRVLPVINTRSGEPWEMMHVPIAEIQVTSVGTYSSVGRMVSKADPKSLPVLDYPGIMVGDFVEQMEPLPYF